MFRIFLAMLLLIAPMAKAQTDSSLLYRAYQQQSQPLLKQFFNKWYNNNHLKNKTFTRQENMIRQVIGAFYKKENLIKMNEYEYFNRLYKPASYLVFPNAIAVHEIKYENSIRYVSKKGKRMGVINNFRPLIPTNGKKIIYLNAENKKLMDDFLLVNYPRGVTKEYIEYVINEREKRQDFLTPMITLVPSSSWGYNLTAVTYPKFVSIYLDAKNTTAIVDFKSTKGGGAEAIFKKVKNKWVFSSVQPTWME